MFYQVIPVMCFYEPMAYRVFVRVDYYLTRSHYTIYLFSGPDGYAIGGFLYAGEQNTSVGRLYILLPGCGNQAKR